MSYVTKPAEPATKSDTGYSLLSERDADHYYYHSTYPDNIPSIKEHGLQPRVEGRQEVAQLATTPDLHSAHFFMYRDGHSSEDWALLRFPKTIYKDKVHNEEDTEDMPGYTTFRCTILSEHLEVYHDGQWKTIENE